MHDRSIQNPTLPAPPCDDRLIGATWAARFYLPTLLFADESGLFALLEQAPATAEEVAAHLGFAPHGMEVVLGMLSALGFLNHQQGRFSLSETASTYLLPQSFYYAGSTLRIQSQRPFTAASLRELLEKEREQAASPPNVSHAWRAGEVPAAIAAQVTAALHAHSLPCALLLAQQIDLSGVQHLLDVAGGSGCYCIALAQRFASPRFTVLELPTVCPLVAQYVASAELSSRIATLAANMFSDPWPTDCDAIFFSDVFHYWDQARCLHLARHSFEALPPGGHIFLHEMLLNEQKDGPLVILAYSMNMLGFLGGKIYTAEELQEMLQEAGFINVQVQPAYGYYSLISAQKPV